LCGKLLRLMLSCNQLLAKYFQVLAPRLPWIDDNSGWRGLFFGTTYLHFCNLWFIKLRGNNYRFLWPQQQTEYLTALANKTLSRLLIILQSVSNDSWHIFCSARNDNNIIFRTKVNYLLLLRKMWNQGYMAPFKLNCLSVRNCLIIKFIGEN